MRNSILVILLLVAHIAFADNVFVSYTDLGLEPISGASVQLKPVQTNIWTTNLISRTAKFQETSEDGSCVFTNVVPATYDLICSGSPSFVVRIGVTNYGTNLVYASGLAGVAIDSSSVIGYTRTQVDGIFANKTNTAMVGTPTIGGTNIFDIFSATSGTTYTNYSGLNAGVVSNAVAGIGTNMSPFIEAATNSSFAALQAGDVGNISRNSGTGTNLNVYGTNYLGERAYIGNPANISVRPGRYSLAVGSGPTASGENALAVGSGANADGNSSVAFGLTTATGAGAFSHGDETRAEGNASHSEGNECIALGFASHAEGNWSTAWADWTHADGDHTDARAPYSHTAGRYSQSLHVGTYVWSDDTYFIANGTNFPSSDSNQFSVFASGGIRLLGGPISGNGSGLTSLNASQLTSGTVPPNVLGATNAIQSLTEDYVYIRRGTNAPYWTNIVALLAGKTLNLSASTITNLTTVSNATSAGRALTSLGHIEMGNGVQFQARTLTVAGAVLVSTNAGSARFAVGGSDRLSTPFGAANGSDFSWFQDTTQNLYGKDANNSLAYWNLKTTTTNIAWTVNQSGFGLHSNGTFTVNNLLVSTNGANIINVGITNQGDLMTHP